MPGLLAGLIVFAGLHSFQVAGADSAGTKSALEANPQGWLDILPAADLKGWYRVPVPPGGKLGRDQWHVDSERKVLICDGDGGHDMLLFNREIGDAIFHVEFCYTKIEGKTGYNSGAYVRNSKTAPSGTRPSSVTPRTDTSLAKRPPLTGRRSFST